MWGCGRVVGPCVGLGAAVGSDVWVRMLASPLVLREG